MASRFFYEVTSSRLVRFLLVHIVITIAAILVLVGRQHGLQQYGLVFTAIYLGSLAAGFLGFGQFIAGCIKGFSGAGTKVLLGHALPLPVVLGVAAIGAFVLLIAGCRSRAPKYMYPLLILSSVLFICTYHVYFNELLGNGVHMIGQ